MASKFSATREELEEFIEFVRDPLPKFVPTWKYLEPRQKEVLRNLIYRDITYRELALELNISHQTVKNHVWNAINKKGVRLRPHEIRGRLLERLREMANELI